MSRGILGALAAVGLVGCASEDWKLAPTVEAAVEVADGQQAVTGVAVLTYARAALPDPDRVVSNALRVTVSSSVRRDLLTLTLDGPRGTEIGLEEPESVNLEGVYADCGEARCTVEVPFAIARTLGAPGVVTVEADAILTTESPIHEVTPDDERASLEIVFDEPGPR